MRYSEFWDLMTGVFGPVYARTLADDQVLGALGDRTANQALADGEDVRAVWAALCDAMEVPQERRYLDRGGKRPGERHQRRR